MRTIVVWGIVLALLASVGYSALMATRERQPTLPVSAGASPCRVVSYDLLPGGSSISAVVICAEAGRYQVSAKVTSSGVNGSGQVSVKLAREEPTTVVIGITPKVSPQSETYSAQFRVKKA